jgi:hypothetical protein
MKKRAVIKKPVYMKISSKRFCLHVKVAGVVSIRGAVLRF